MRNLVARLLLGATFVGALSTAGCYATATARPARVYVAEVQTAPPRPRVIHVRQRPGYVYVQGRWTWDGYDWRWVDGHYVRQRPGYVYSQGRWVQRGGRYVWVDGGWRTRGDGRTYVNTYRRR
jgi:hypothetical protein